jgi:putative sigma-54 modulation protein
MQVEIVTRHFNLSDEQRDKIEAAVEKLERFSPRPVVEARLTLTHESGKFSGDSVLYLRNNEFRAKADGMEPELAASEMVESLRKQLSKFKGKISGRQKGEGGGLGKAMLNDAALGEARLEIGEAEGFVLQDMDVESAQQALRDSDRPFLVFRNLVTSRVAVVYRRRDGGFGLMEATGE